MLRAISIIIITVLCLALSFNNAYFGLLLYNWYSFFSPLELTYGLLADSRLSFVVAAVFILTGIFQTRLLFRKSIITLIVIVFCAGTFMGLAVLGTYNIKSIIDQTQNLNKLAIIAIFSPVLVTNVSQLRYFILTIAVSVGFLAFYYGVFGLFSGSTFISGAGRIGDNNFYALLLVTTLPLLFLSIKYLKNIILKFFLLIISLGTLLAIVLTYSRGGFLATIVVLLLWLFSWRRKLLIPTLISVACIYYVITGLGLVRGFDEFAFEREFRSSNTVSETIDNYILRIMTLLNSPEETESGRSRLHFWKVAVLMANDKPLFGVGLGRFEAEYSAYDFSSGEFGTARAVHSTPMLILAELGYLGLACFSSLILAALIILLSIKQKLKRLSQTEEIGFIIDCVNTIMIAIVGFMVAGSLVVGLYLEIFWSLMTLTIICEYLTKQILNENTSNNSMSSIPAR